MLRLGVLTPSSNTVLEPLSVRLMDPLAERVSIHFSRLRVTAISDRPSSNEQFSPEAMARAASLLADARVDAVLWAGTSGAWQGLAADRAIVAAVEEACGVRATTATLALLDALKLLGVRRYGLVVPYVAAIADAIVSTLAAASYRCVARSLDSITVNWDFAAIPGDVIARRIGEVARDRPDAVVIHCTNLRGAEVAAAAERELDLPVLDSVAVGLWGALGLLGIERVPQRFGRLSRLRPPGAPSVSVGASGA